MGTNSKIQSFRDLTIWQDAIKLVKVIYETTKTFPSAETYGLTSQIRRAAVSVPSNIAEGHIRNHRAEFKQFLFIALGSLAELETQMIIASELGYMDEESKEKIIERITVIGRQIRSLVSKLNPNPQSPTPRKS
ncbi:MAG: four helix bundle protein [Nitrospirae bacterium]|nr:four helix bundle protein [Nitrospirota bacterium]